MQPDPKEFTGSCEFIDTGAHNIVDCARSLTGADREQTAKNCFEFVRDNIKHSADFRLNPVTCRASDVLRHRTGYCYAKSHLLCALLRVHGIPAGMCYQRLSIDGESAPFCLHGLNAVHLEEFGWYRVDARGNKEGVNATFSPPLEQLAFSITLTGERDLNQIWRSPHPAVVECLTQNRNWQEVYHNLPDVEGCGD